MENHSENEETALSDKENDEKTPQTGQIPLLDDVVFNTELPFPKPRKSRPNRSAKDSTPPENTPRPTDLFGGSAETAQTGPHSPDYEAKDLDELRANSEEMVDHLVAEYSQEIVSRLKKELSSLLDDLDEHEKDPDQA